MSIKIFTYKDIKDILRRTLKNAKFVKFSVFKEAILDTFLKLEFVGTTRFFFCFYFAVDQRSFSGDTNMSTHNIPPLQGQIHLKTQVLYKQRKPQTCQEIKCATFSNVVSKERQNCFRKQFGVRLHSLYMNRPRERKGLYKFRRLQMDILW